jgi:hypothetical protein
VSPLPPCERLADRPRRGVHGQREGGARIIEGADLAERDAAEVAEERALVIGQEHVPVFGFA